MPAAVLLALVLAQAPPVEAGEAAKIERIRKTLTEVPAITVSPVTHAEGTVFRLTVLGRKHEKTPWDDWSPVPTNIRPWFRSYHHEFLERVTPEEFRSATLYPMGFVTTEMIEYVVKRIKALNRKMTEADARREVQQALEELRACRENPARPDCPKH
jgi:hypothetical protein